VSEDASKRFDVIGVPRRRVDGRAKVTGQTVFADDIDLPRMLHCKLLRSPLPHALICGLDVARARAHPGVHLVLTGADVPIEFGILPVSQDEEAICTAKVRYVGDPVAAVVAKDEITATDALDQRSSIGTVVHNPTSSTRVVVPPMSRRRLLLLGVMATSWAEVSAIVNVVPCVGSTDRHLVFRSVFVLLMPAR